MPIDFATIATLFAQLGWQDRLANVAGSALQADLDKRLAASRVAESSSRDLPALSFEDGALAVRVVAAVQRDAIDAVSQFGAVALVAPNAVGAGWDRWLHAASDLPAFFDAADRLLAAADASIVRYASPGPEAFDPRRQNMLDIVGVGAAFFTTMKRASAPGGDLDRLAIVVAASALVLRPDPIPASSSGLPVADMPGPPSQRADDPDAIAVAAALMFLALPRLVSTMLEAVDIRAHLITLDVLAKVERGVRRAISGCYEVVFANVRSMGYRLLQLVYGIGTVVGGFVVEATTFAVKFGTGFAVAIRDFVYQLARFLKVIVGLAEVVVALLETLGLDRWVPSDIPIAPEAPPLQFKSEFGGFDKTLFGDDVRMAIGNVIKATDEGMRAELTAGLRRTGTGLLDAAGAFSRLAGTVTDIPAVGTRVLDDATLWADKLFIAEPPPAQRDPMAQALESWLSVGGIRVLAEVLDGYARHVAARWHARYSEEAPPGGPQPGRPTPTSPHILRRNAVPARVEVPRVLVRVGTPVDGDVAATVAAEVAGAVRTAYRIGAQRSSTAGGE